MSRRGVLHADGVMMDCCDVNPEGRAGDDYGRGGGRRGGGGQGGAEGKEGRRARRGGGESMPRSGQPSRSTEARDCPVAVGDR